MRPVVATVSGYPPFVHNPPYGGSLSGSHILMTTANTLNPARIFEEMIASIEDRRETERERNRRSCERWRAKQDPEELKERQRQWEKDYRTRLKASNPKKYKAYCKV